MELRDLVDVDTVHPLLLGSNSTSNGNEDLNNNGEETPPCGKKVQTEKDILIFSS